MARRTTEHPAMALMRHEARGHMRMFLTDLDNHDAAELAKRPHHAAFAWIMHTHATWLTFASVEPRKYAPGALMARSYGADDTRFYFWDGAVFVRCGSAHAVDGMLAAREDELRERERAGRRADQGVM